MEVYLNSISKVFALIDDGFQCTFPFFLTFCMYGIVEQGYEAIAFLFHIGCKGTN